MKKLPFLLLLASNFAHAEASLPALTADHLRVSAAHLRDGLDAVLLPVDDGGYVMLGMRQPPSALFTGIAWSTDTVAAETRRRLARLGLSWREPARLWDVDRPEDLARLDDRQNLGR